MQESVSRTCNLDVHSSHCQTGKNHAIPLNHGPTSFYLKRTETVHACKWWLIRYNSVTGKVCHDLTFSFPPLTSACNIHMNDQRAVYPKDRVLQTLIQFCSQHYIHLSHHRRSSKLKSQYSHWFQQRNPGFANDEGAVCLVLVIFLCR